MVWEAGPVVVFEHGVGRDDGLDDAVVYVPPNLANIIAVLSKPSVDSAYPPVQRDQEYRHLRDLKTS